MSWFEILGLLLVGHALADYPLQGDFLARAKNHLNPIKGIPYYQALGAHSVIHAGFVGVVTGSVWLALCEFVAHAVIDHEKCEGTISYNKDQALHIACKVAWVAVLMVFA